MKKNKKNYRYLGKGYPLIEGLEKVTGKAKYVEDLKIDGMLHAKILFSPHAHARIISINKIVAEEIPGVVAVLCAQDLPTKNQLMASRNSAILAKDKVIFHGQPVVVVVAESASIAQDAIDKVFIDYEPLESVIDPIKAMSDQSPTIWPDGLPTEISNLSGAHSAVKAKGESESKSMNNVYASQHFERGDIRKGFIEADIVVEKNYKLNSVHQAYLEPHAVVVEPDIFRGSLTFYTSTQGQFLVRDEVSRILSIPKHKIRVVPMTFGGGFGAKYGILEPLAGAVALTVKRPIRFVLSRSEDLQTTTPSPNVHIFLKTSAKKDGFINALEARIILDNGIFGLPLSGLLATLIGGYYKIENTSIDCYEVNTNKPQIGAYRAPGAPQITFALESNVDEMAEQLGLDKLDFRYQNAVETGDLMGNNEPWPNLGLKSCLDSLRDNPTWKLKVKKANEGIGIAIGGWTSFMGPASAICRVESDGMVRIHVGSVDISGVNSSFVLIAAEVLGVSPNQVEIIQGDTLTGPFAPNSGGSQITYSVSGAVTEAAEEAKNKILQLAADHFEASINDLETHEGLVHVRGVPHKTISIGKLASIAQSKPGGPGPIAGQGQSAIQQNAPCFTVHLAKVSVDRDTGRVTPLQCLAIHDVGYALNPTMVHGQIHGGVVQGIGMALHEAMLYDDEGQLLTGSFMEYDFPKADCVPSIETILIENPSPNGPFGVRGIGEPPIIPVGAAIANAVNDAIGVRCTELPIPSEILWQKSFLNNEQGIK
ncbi:MAG: xanthine dehydrogenase family protein molybdopterin-binding subunit [Deltaproteobacteria bacterium]|nr:xanthine dehydrogenase family protein molybdopterin-binding subunit [Deltaproteobacteria bacterium]